MIKATNILYIYTETPLHAGSGSGLSNVDLPIQRERTTQYPMIQGSGIKGKLRAAAEDEQWPDIDIDVIFGSSRDIKGVTQNGATPLDNAGALIVGDARILLFPVRSLNGTFAYTTSYDVLQRFARDLERSHISIKEDEEWNVPSQPREEPDAEMPTALVTSRSKLTIDVSPASDATQSADDSQSGKETIVLEEFSFKAQKLGENGQVNKITEWLAKYALPQYEDTYWKEKLKSSLVILPNDEFRDFVLYATEVITRIGIERKTKIVKEGALWTEEHLPTDTLLYVPIYATHSRKIGQPMTAGQVLQRVSELKSSLQLGGDETVGRGFVSTRWSDVQTLQEAKAASNGNATTTTRGEAAS